MLLGFTIIVLFFIIFTLLNKLIVFDSVGNKNNALLAFYFAIALWIVACLGGVYSNVYSAMYSDQPKAGRNTSSKKNPYSSHYSIVLWGLGILSSVYVVRRREWAQLFINAIGAWKGKDIQNEKEILIAHGINYPEDREWVSSMILLLDKEYGANEEDSKIPISKEFEDSPK